ncbi:hypothetical protein A2867_02510 [Candidatus Daviesbacteria bacterium RIFCSPHIGHO2_01_FULL_40_11]|uniref:Uncharacterized protein n=1 Tax=Candidatus Daviesbacteria bacterium RIFCSPHIGHO2_01_FULL_40_11 TaxID=1797762 RepID=A0A1F5JFL3_9BACT|nr:MAG: hypothetical protein A2867_02510 [Candidatus Daviesbacteria bacterium RIFCSPHIGHO2_01_FULL_40_11]
MERLAEPLTDSQKQIPVPWTPQDYGLYRLTEIYRKLTIEEQLLSPDRIQTITRVAIDRFCRLCDNLGENGVCQKLPEYDQTRYAAREWCAQASIDGESVYMTVSGPQT